MTREVRQKFNDALCYIGIPTLTCQHGCPGQNALTSPLTPSTFCSTLNSVDQAYADGSRIIANERLIAAKMAAPTYAEAQAAEIETALPKQPTPIKTWCSDRGHDRP